jgi:exosome complex component RRP4
MNKMAERKIVVPGEVIAKGDDLLPGEWTEKINGEVIALKYGLSEEANKLVKVIPLSGVYNPRRGNVVIGKVENITFNGWILDIGTPETAFLSLMEVPKFVNKDNLEEVMEIGDSAVVKIWGINKRGIDLSLKSRELGKIEQGLIIKINPYKVPRVIGKEGSMIKIIKDETNCDVTVGQNGFIWIQGDTVDDELFAKKAINFVSENSFVNGLTEELKKWFGENKK